MMVATIWSSMSAKSSPEPKMDRTSYTNVDSAAQDISDALNQNASVAVETDAYGIVRVIDVSADHDEEVVDLYTKEKGGRSVYPAEIKGIEVSKEFEGGDRVETEDGQIGTIVSINETVGSMTNRATIRDDHLGDMSITVGELTLLDEAKVKCAGDDCCQPATEEINGCVLGKLNYTLRVCRSCAEETSKSREGR